MKKNKKKTKVLVRKNKEASKAKLYCKYLIHGINTRVFIRYSGPFLKRTKEGLRYMNFRTKKLITMLKDLYAGDNSK